MAIDDREITQRLLTTDEEFKKLHEQHQEMEQMLAKFKGRLYLSPSEEAEVKRLKKKKLLRKDEMYRKIFEYKKHMDV